MPKGDKKKKGQPTEPEASQEPTLEPIEGAQEPEVLETPAREIPAELAEEVEDAGELEATQDQAVAAAADTAGKKRTYKRFSKEKGYAAARSAAFQVLLGKLDLNELNLKLQELCVLGNGGGKFNENLQAAVVETLAEGEKTYAVELKQGIPYVVGGVEPVETYVAEGVHGTRGPSYPVSPATAERKKLRALPAAPAPATPPAEG